MPPVCDNTGRPCWMLQAPERLLVQGFRCVLNGYRSGDPSLWDSAQDLYADELGGNLGNYAIEALWRFVEAYKSWSINQASCHAVNCPMLCREECVVLSLISAMQHQDGPCARYCLKQMVEPEGFQMTEVQAFALGAGFLAAGQRLMPVPLPVVRNIADHRRPATVH